MSSGATSDFFVDCKRVVLRAEGHALVGEALHNAVRSIGGSVDINIGAVAGVELGGCPLASAVATLSHAKAPSLDAIYVRKSAKGHGSKKMIEGAGHLPKGTRVAVLEDTVTTGGSTLAAIEKLQQGGFIVAGVVAVVDRSEGGAEAITNAGFPFAALYSRSDFMGDA